MIERIQENLERHKVITRMVLEGVSVKQVAKQFGITGNIVSRIVRDILDHANKVDDDCAKAEDARNDHDEALARGRYIGEIVWAKRHKEVYIKGLNKITQASVELRIASQAVAIARKITSKRDIEVTIAVLDGEKYRELEEKYGIGTERIRQIAARTLKRANPVVFQQINEGYNTLNVAQCRKYSELFRKQVESLRS